MTLWRRLRRAGAILAVVAAAGGATAEGYRLQPGDSLRLSVSGLPEFSTQVSVGIEGYIRIPQFGPVLAQDRTIEEIEAELRVRVAGQSLKRYNADGVPVFIGIDAEDVSLDIAGFRPVYVSGDVGQPGAVPFTPGLTARAAIAASGGPRAGGLLRASLDPVRDEARLQAEYRLQFLAGAELRLDIWRIRAELAEEPASEPPTMEALGVTQDVYDEMMAVTRERLDISIAALEGQRAFLRSAISQADERLGILSQQGKLQAVAVKDDEEELKRVSTLYERGVVPITRLAEIRGAQLASATRLLQTEDSRTRLALDRTRFERDVQSLGEERKAGLKVALQTAQRQLRETSIRLASTRQQLEAIGAAPPVPGPEQARMEIVLHRRDAGGETQTRPVTPEERLAPGDVIEVRVIDPLTGPLD